MSDAISEALDCISIDMRYADDPQEGPDLSGMDQAVVNIRELLDGERAAGRLAGLREAAEVARATKSYDDNLQKSAGCHTTGERIAGAIKALANEECPNGRRTGA